MLQFVFDSDHLTHYSNRHPAVLARYSAEPAGTLGLTPVTVEEALRGRLAVLSRRLDGAARILAYERLLATLRLLNQFPVAPFNQACEDQFQQLLTLRLSIGRQDLKMAAVALAHKLVLLTCNVRDFGQVPGLQTAGWTV
jgi:tRNA(fMet)-specific endonuclease VapC